MGFSKLFGGAPSAPATVSTPPPTVSDTQDRDTQADYEQRASRRRGLLSTILSNRRQSEGNASATASGNTTLG